MFHDINLNIHHTVPLHLWEEVKKVFASMPYWAGEKYPQQWIGKNIDLKASVEPSGIQIFGEMPEEIWEKWYSMLKNKLTHVMGYEIGEPEDGYDFKYFS